MAKSHFLPLETISKTGPPPSSRVTDPASARELVDRLERSNSERNRTDAVVYGLFSGNPPYRSSELRKAGQSWRSNVNWRIAESFLQTALTSYWDAVTSSPSLCSVRTAFGSNQDQREEWSAVITEEFDRLNHADANLNYMFELSQHDMVLYRMGPVVWFDPLDYRAQAVPQQYLYVLDDTRSNLQDWPCCVIRVATQVHELWSKISNAEAATAAGWNVPEARQAIMEAAPETMWPNNQRYDWLWYEQKLRQNDIYYSENSETIPVAYVLWKEFMQNGQEEISMCAVVENSASPNFLYWRPRKYGNWKELICPFYYDGGDGKHHSVKGLGIKAYGALETYNRLQCHLVDAAVFGSSMHFQAQTGTDLNNLSVIPMGPYIWHPPGGTYLPTMQLGTALDGPMAIKQDVLQTLTNNLSAYRQQLAMKEGNPLTAREVEYHVESTGNIARSQMSRYFEQLDDFWGERFRRATNTKLTTATPGGKECIAFQKACRDRGVPLEALRQLESIRATRTIGYGSPDARNQIMLRLMNMIPLLSEGGRQKVLEDVISNMVGLSLMRRYVPDSGADVTEMDQAAEARQNVGGMKTGVTPLVTPSQNPLIHATTYIEASAQVLQSGNPADAVKFIETAAPAVEAHLARLAKDPTRKDALQALGDKWKQIRAVQQKLMGQLQQQMQKQMQMRQRMMEAQNEANQEFALEAQKAKADMALKGAKQNQAMALKEAQTRQKMHLNDLTTANKLRLSALQAQAKAEEPQTSSE